MGEFVENDNKAVICRWFEEVFNQGREEVIDEIVSADYIDYGHNPPGRGPEGARQDFRDFFAAFSDVHYTIDDLLADGDKVAARWTGHFTHSGDNFSHGGEMAGVPATGKRVTLTGISVYRLANGQIVSTHLAGDMLGFMQQIGALPSLT